MRLTSVFLGFMVTAVLLSGCGGGDSRFKELVDYIPESADAVIKIARLETTREDFSKNSLMGQLKGEPFSQFFEEYNQFISGIKTSDRVLLSSHHLNDNTTHFLLIGKYNQLYFKPDSLEGASTNTLKMENHTVLKTTLQERSIFSVALDSAFLVATSETLLKDVFQGKVKKNPNFLKAFKVKTDKELTMIASLNNNGITPGSNIKWAEQASFELQLLPDGVVGHGVILDQDSLPQIVSLFRGQVPQKTDAPTIIPANADRAISLSFSNSEALEIKLRNVLGDSIVLHPLFETINEMVEIEFPEGNAMALKSLDKDLSWEDLASDITEGPTFREVTLFNLSEEQNYFTPFSPLFHTSQYRIVFEWEDFLFFTENNTQAELIISSLQNESVLAKTSYFENTSTYLAAASSLVFYEMKGKSEGLFTALLDADDSPISKFPVLVTQLIYDRNFAHLNLVAKETSGTSPSGGLMGQLINVTLENNIFLPPKFFTNHNTLGKDIVVQDVSNKLYFIGSNGKILWKKVLDGPIQGTIQEVDMLRNGKKQLAFSTLKSFYVLDRNGNAVAPFPKTFKDEITQPVAIFDYDNNRKYRFIIVQKDKVFMYDSQGKSVDGFSFKKANSNIVLPPQHLRIGNKDYILIAEENGKLNILNRVGKDRITVKKQFSFGEIPVEREVSDFVVITKDHIKETIDLNGKVSSLPLNVSPNYWFTIVGSVKVTLDDNLLRVNGKLIELPVGVYGKPQVFSTKNQVYVAVTETEEKKVFVYDKNGKLFNNFPVYGTSEIDLGDANRNNKLNVLVQGQPNEVILYQSN
jgi:hypothetical protein